MTKVFSKSIEDLLTSEARNYINTAMIDDISHFITVSKADKAELVYNNKILHIIRTEHGGIKLSLEINGKTIDMIPND